MTTAVNPAACLIADGPQNKVERRAAATPTYFVKETTSVASSV